MLRSVEKHYVHNHSHAVGMRPINGCIPNGMQRMENRHFSTERCIPNGMQGSYVIFACLMLSSGSRNDDYA